MQYRAKGELQSCLLPCPAVVVTVKVVILDILTRFRTLLARPLVALIPSNLCTDGSQVTEKTKFLRSKEGKAP